MIKIGITGSAASGKTTVCNRFRELGLPVVSADDLARQAVKPGTDAHKNIIARFGDDVMEPDGQLNRKKIRERILKDPESRKDLEQIVHPEILRLMKHEMQQAEMDDRRMMAVEVPLLFELGLQSFFDIIVTVYCPEKMLLDRLMVRDRVTRNQGHALLEIQMPGKKKAQQSDFVIKNDSTHADLIQKVDDMYRILSEKNTIFSKRP